jgi:anti-sigma B factor antagonist
MPATHFDIDVRPLDRGVTHVILSGELDLAVAPELWVALEGLVREGETKLLIDLTPVRFVDSTALGVLHDTLKRLRQRRGRMAVVCPDQSMRDLFQLVGYNLIFPVEETRDKALAHLGGRRRFSGRPHK